MQHIEMFDQKVTLIEHIMIEQNMSKNLLYKKYMNLWKMDLKDLKSINETTRGLNDLKRGIEQMNYYFEYWMEPTKKRRQSAFEIANDIVSNYNNFFIRNPILKTREDRINQMKEIIPKNLPQNIKNYLTGNERFTQSIKEYSGGHEIILEICDWFL